MTAAAIIAIYLVLLLPFALVFVGSFRNNNPNRP